MAEKSIETINEYALSAGQNMPNHSTSLAGRGHYVRQGVPDVPTFRTKQAAFRYAAYIVLMAEAHLPDEEGSATHTFPQVLDAISNT